MNATLEERLLERVEKANNMNELVEVCNSIVDEIINSDERVFSVGKDLSGYGSWKIKLWLNEYHFGSQLKERIEKKYIITHDEDKEPTIEDCREIIDDVISEMAHENW